MAPDILEARRIVPLADAADTLSISTKTLLRKMDERGIPLVAIGPRSRGVKLPDLGLLIAVSERPAIVEAV